jgi:glutamine amidotransferase
LSRGADWQPRFLFDRIVRPASEPSIRRASMIAIVDYGMGNLRSVQKALEKLGHAADVTSDARVIRAADRLILPGVGAFGAAMAHLNGEQGGTSLVGDVKDFAATGKPLLGICLGMQLLFSRSEELGEHQGLGLVPGDVVKFEFDDPALKIPHMGWNNLSFPRESRLFRGVEAGASVYFVHSFWCRPEDASVTAAECEHGLTFCAGVEKDNLFAAQFHPEKSGAPGLRILDNFARL